MLDLTAGPANLSLAQIVEGIFHPDRLDPRRYVIIWQVRLPDTLTALAIGSALGLAGVETQTVLNNPLASPYTLGISSAATVGAAIAIIIQPVIGWIPPSVMLPGLAFVTAMAASMSILLLTILRRASISSIVLYGIALVFLCEAIVTGLQYIASAEAVDQIVFWTAGDLTRAGWREVSIVTAVFVPMLILGLYNAWPMTALRGGEHHAESIGIAVSRMRIFVMLRASILAAIAVAFVGAIGFVGLVGPHIARMLLGEDHRFLIPGACLTGAVMLLLASCLAKTLLPGAIIPVGVVTAIVGVPVFLVLISLGRGETAWR